MLPGSDGPFTSEDLVTTMSQIGLTHWIIEGGRTTTTYMWIKKLDCGEKMKIVTDSACDMPPQEVEELGITVAPLLIRLPEGEIKSADITPDDFYNRLREMAPQIPTTSQPSSGMFKEIYQQLTESEDEILSIHISSGLSGTIESARAAAQQMSGQAQIEIFDTMTLSGAQRFQVLAAAWAVKAGWSKKRILERMELIRAQTEIIYTLETLEYLARGGRIGRVQALAGMLLKIKPLIRVEKADGKYSTAGKERTIQRALSSIATHLEGLYGKTAVWATVLHGQFGEPAAILNEMLKSKLNVARDEIMRVSPVLGVHTGPGVVGVAVMPVSLVEDLL